MISADDARHTIEFEKYYVILPELAKDETTPSRPSVRAKGRPVSAGFVYASHTNTEWLTKEQLDQYIQQIPAQTTDLY